MEVLAAWILRFSNPTTPRQKKMLKKKYNLKIDDKKQKNRTVSNILKMNENNQIGNAVTKPLPYGCIKNKKDTPGLRKFNFILQNLSLNDKIRHLFVVDIIFDEKNADKKHFCLTKFTCQFLKKSC